MASYKLLLKKSVAKDLRSIPDEDVVRMLQRVQGLQEDPRPIDSEKLSGQERYRIRQGAYRIVYEVSDETVVVTIVKVGHHKDVYMRY